MRQGKWNRERRNTDGSMNRTKKVDLTQPTSGVYAECVRERLTRWGTNTLGDNGIEKGG
jgi:hypothetical protein